MRNSDIIFSSPSNETSNINNNVRYPIQLIPFHSQNHNLYYQTPMALHLTNRTQLNTNNNNNNNNVIYPPIYHIAPPHLLITVPCAPAHLMADSSNMTLLATPPSTQILINYSLSKWSDICLLFDGDESSRPSAGRLANGKYFTKRSAGKDIYMVFNTKGDYINNFVNYYFSNKNFSTDEKLFNLMDDNGSVALTDLMKFPRLAHIGTTDDDIVEALKMSHFVVIVNLKNNTKGIRRADGWFPSKLIDKSQFTAVTPSKWPNGEDGVAGDSSNGSTTLTSSNTSSFHKSPSQETAHLTMKLLPPPPTQSSNLDNISSSSLCDSGAVPKNNIVFFNNNNNNTNNVAIHQSMFAAASAYGIHENNVVAAPMIGLGGHSQKLLLNTQSHFSPTIFQQHQSQLRPTAWHSQNNNNMPDYVGRQQQYNNHYSSLFNNNIRHVIGAAGNIQINQKQCQY